MNADLRKVFFPLRSNAGWFTSPNLKADLEDRLKQAILLYDEIIIEDGTYSATVWEKSCSDLYIPPSPNNIDLRKISVEKDIKNTERYLRIRSQGSPPGSGTIIASGQTAARYKIDYFEFINKLVGCDFIKPNIIVDDNIKPELKNALRRQTDRDKKIYKDSDKNPRLINLIIKNLNRDLLVSSLLQTSLILDPIHTELLTLKSRESLDNMLFLPDKESAIVRKLIRLKVPNFREISLEGIIELRQESLWQEFRNNIGQISNTITNNPDLLLDNNLFNEAVNESINQALFKEIEKREKNGVELAADLILGGLSMIPVVGYVPTGLGMIRSLADFDEQRKGWIAFLIKASNKSK